MEGNIILTPRQAEFVARLIVHMGVSDEEIAQVLTAMDEDFSLALYALDELGLHIVRHQVVRE